MSPSLPERLQPALRRLRAALLPDRLGIALYPERLVLTRTSGGRRRELKHKQTLPFAPAAVGTAPWQPALAALEGLLAAGALADAELTLVLSNHFVRYAVVPWSEALSSREEHEAFTRHSFERVYGSAAENWTFRLTEAGAASSRLACAIECELAQALAGALAPLKGRYHSLQPHLMASFNRVRAGLGTLPAWLAVAEPGLVCLALLDGSQWQSVVTLRVGADWLRELPGLIAREECMVDSDSACERVLVVAPDAAGAKMPQADRRRFEMLLPAAVPGLKAELEPAFGIALGA